MSRLASVGRITLGWDPAVDLDADSIRVRLVSTTGGGTGIFTTTSPHTYGTVFAHPKQPCKMMQVDDETVLDLSCGTLHPADEVFKVPGWKVVEDEADVGT